MSKYRLPAPDGQTLLDPLQNSLSGWIWKGAWFSWMPCPRRMRPRAPWCSNTEPITCWSRILSSHSLASIPLLNPTTLGDLKGWQGNGGRGMIFKGGVGARFRLGAHVPSTLAVGHATKTIALGCLPTGFSATEPFVELWSSERLHADSSQAQGLPAGAGVGRLRRSAFCFLARIFHTPMETPTVRRVRARGLHARTSVPVGRVPSRGVRGCEICELKSKVYRT